jgi:hypothetical protein
MSIYRIILAIHYTFLENWTIKRLSWHLKSLSSFLQFIASLTSIAFTSGNENVDSAFLMIKISMAEFRSAMGSWWPDDDELHWARDIQKS